MPAWQVRKLELSTRPPSNLSPPSQPPALLALDDEVLASQSAARLLITSSRERGAETVARRIHGAGSRASFPFVERRAVDFPIETGALRKACSDLLDAAAGGSVLISDVEEMPATVQEMLIEVLNELEFARGESAHVRVMCGTSVSLLNCIAARTFSERLFYRLNVIHLTASV